MSWMRWNNKTRRMFILIVSLLFVLQSITIIGLAKTGDDDKNDGSDGSNNNTDSSVNGTGDGDDCSNTTNEEGDESEKIEILNDIFNRFSTPKSKENTGTPTITTDVETVETNPNNITPGTCSSKLEKYVEALSSYPFISEGGSEHIFISSLDAEKKVVTVTSNELVEVTFLGNVYHVSDGESINVKIPDSVANNAKSLLVTAEVVTPEGEIKYAKYVFLDNNNLDNNKGDVYHQDNQDSLLQFLSNMLSNMLGLYCFGE